MSPGISANFAAHFGAPPVAVVRAPGRVNLVGEHTDYSEGYVLPIAIRYGLDFAGALRTDRICRLYSCKLNETDEFSLDSVLPGPTGYWGNYLRGVAQFLQLEGRLLQGCDVLIEGNLPIGAGLSSSAALEVGFAYLLQAICGFELEPIGMAQLCQQAENQFARMNCGIMDQMICRLGQKDCALFLDCRTLQSEQIPLPAEGWVALLADTHVKHQLVASAYNERRQQTAEAAGILAQRMPGVLSLRDVGPEDLDVHGVRLPSVLYQRARHVVDENERVHKAVSALRDGDLKHFGAILNESHTSLRDNFEVSCPELDCLAAVAQELAGVYGARMVGGGFGGCVLIICRPETVRETQEELSAIFSRHFGRIPAFYQTTAESGVHRISPD